MKLAAKTMDAAQDYTYANGIVGAVIAYYDDGATVAKVASDLEEYREKNSAIDEALEWMEGVTLFEVRQLLAANGDAQNLQAFMELVLRENGHAITGVDASSSNDLQALFVRALDADMPELMEALENLVTPKADPEDVRTKRILVRAVKKGSNAVFERRLARTDETFVASLLFEAVLAENNAAFSFMFREFPGLLQNQTLINGLFQTAAQYGNVDVMGTIVDNRRIGPEQAIQGFVAVMTQDEFAPIFPFFLGYVERQSAKLGEATWRNILLSTLYAYSLKEDEKLRVFALAPPQEEPFKLSLLRTALAYRGFMVATALTQPPFSVSLRTNDAATDYARLVMFASELDWLFTVSGDYTTIDDATVALLDTVVNEGDINITARNQLLERQRNITATIDLLGMSPGPEKRKTYQPSTAEALVSVAMRGHWQAAPEMLKRVEEDKSLGEGEKGTAVKRATTYAIAKNNVPLLEVLLPAFTRYHGSVDAVFEKGDEGPYTLLCYALEASSNAAVVRYLLERAGADPSKPVAVYEGSGRLSLTKSTTPLLAATSERAWFGMSPVEYLLRRGADPSVLSGLAVRFAIANGHEQATEAMIMADEYDPIEGGTPLAWYSFTILSREPMNRVFEKFVRKISEQGDVFVEAFLKKNAKFFEGALRAGQDGTRIFRNTYYALLFNTVQSAWKGPFANVLIQSVSGLILTRKGAENLRWFEALAEDLPKTAMTQGNAKRRLFAEEANEDAGSSSSSSSSSSDTEDEVSPRAEPARITEAEHASAIINAARENDAERLRQLFFTSTPDTQLLRVAFLQSTSLDDGEETLDENSAPPGSVAFSEGGNGAARGMLVYAALLKDSRAGQALASEMLTVKDRALPENVRRLAQVWQECMVRSATAVPMARLVDALRTISSRAPNLSVATGKVAARQAAVRGKFDLLRAALQWDQARTATDAGVAEAVDAGNATRFLEFAAEQSLANTADVALTQGASAAGGTVGQQEYTRSFIVAAANGAVSVIVKMTSHESSRRFSDEILRHAACAVAANESHEGVIAALLPVDPASQATPALRLALRRALANKFGKACAEVLLARVAFDERALYTEEDLVRCLLAGSDHGVARIFALMSADERTAAAVRHETLILSQSMRVTVTGRGPAKRSKIAQVLRSFAKECERGSLDRLVAAMESEVQ